MNGETPENDNGTVDATEIKLTATGNNRYTLEGIEVGSKENVAADTQIVFTVSVVDADGNVISKSANITVYIVGGDEAVTEITLNSVKLEAKDGTDNKVAKYTIDESKMNGWVLQNAATDIKVDGGTVAVTGNNTITLTLTNPLTTGAKTATVTLKFEKNGVTKEKEVTLGYESDEKQATIELAEASKVAQDWSDSITYTLTDANDGWALTGKVYLDKDCTSLHETATVTIAGDTLTLNGVGEPTDESDDNTAVYVKVTATKAGQADTTVTLTLKYKKAEI